MNSYIRWSSIIDKVRLISIDYWACDCNMKKGWNPRPILSPFRSNALYCCDWGLGLLESHKLTFRGELSTILQPWFSSKSQSFRNICWFPVVYTLLSIRASLNRISAVEIIEPLDVFKGCLDWICSVKF